MPFDLNPASPFGSRQKRCPGRVERRSAAFMAALLLSLPLAAQAYPARGGVGGGGFAGGDRAAGGGYHFSGENQGGAGWRSGYQGSHPMYGPGTRPSWGGGGNQSGSGDRFNRTTLNNGGTVNVNNYNRTTVNRNYSDGNNFYNRNYNGWNNNWRNGGYWNDRPWNTGWFNGGAASWGWFGANAAAWGIAGLATGAMIGGLVNAASAQSSPVFLVPETSYQLNYGSVESVGTYGVSFNYLVNGTQLLGAANCQQGLLNGQVPDNGDQAQLLNAVCQVAYGSGI